MKGFKSFDSALKCNGKQYKVGETYQHNGLAKLCKEGFHFCQHPLDVLEYYNARFAEIEAENVTEEKDNDSKRVCNTIHIKAEITLKSLIDAAIKFTFDKADLSKKETQAVAPSGAASATGASGAASATGYSGAASATGDRGAAEVSGKHSIACGLGFDCKTRGAVGCWIVLAEREYKDNDGWVIICVKSARVDGKKIKADTWYKLVNKEIVLE